MNPSQDIFWWLLVLVGVAVAVFAVLLWLRLVRQGERDRAARDRRRDE